MTHLVRLDDDVYEALKAHAQPFVDRSPNQVIRRILQLPNAIPGQTGSLHRYIPKGTIDDSKGASVDRLRDWYENSDEDTIGDVGTYGGKAWLHMRSDGEHVYFNADTTREGVRRFIQNHDEGARAWRVVRNRRGRENKVTNDPSGHPIPGVFAFTETLGARTV